MLFQAAARQKRHRIADESAVGEARRDAQRLALEEGFSATKVGEVGIVATELANNVWRHAQGGELLLQVLGGSIELLAIDRGRGMADVERCLTDGYSTAGTAGEGLGAIRRLSVDFDLFSTVGAGTVVMARVGSVTSPRFGAVAVAIPGETVSGDAWRVAIQGEEAAVCVVDGLGHGVLAAEAAQIMVDTFDSAPFDEPRTILERSHARMSGTRGAAGACARRLLNQQVHYAGVGNISGYLLAGTGSQGLVSHNGILGGPTRRVQQFQYTSPAGSLLVMHSDGISARWDLDRHPGLSARHPAIIAGVLFRDHARARDDSTIVVLA